jgi:short-subunit dehydrogenase
MANSGDRRVTTHAAKASRVWITGASSGIGAALAREFASRGYVVAATARSEKALAELADSAANIHAFAGDITDRDGMATLVDAIERDLGPIDLAVLNAGIYLPTSFPEFDADIFDRSFSVNLGGTVNCLAPLVPLMSARKYGRIAIVSSVAGYGGLPTSAAYGATKAALFNLGESLAMDVAAHGVKVSMIAPGFVKTPATDVNTFPMPFIISAEDAARRIANGLEKGRAHIAFPKRFSFLLRLINLLPRGAYTCLVGGATNRD